MDKITLRKRIKQQRSELFKNNKIADISKKITEIVRNSKLFKKSRHIALYYPLDGEIDLLGLMQENKNFYFPKCVNNELFFAKYSSEFVKGKYGIKEPDGKIIEPDILDVIYVPCLCSNKKCYRLGYGKGFYDKFFNKYNLPAKKIIVCADCFITDEFVEDKFDYMCDFIISEKML